MFYALLLLACGGDKSLTVATYNAGLAVGFVPGAEDRAPRTTAAIAGLDADVVCLQEYWLPEHIDPLKSAAKKNFPEQVWPEPQQPDAGGKAACAPNDLDDLDTCIRDSCEDACVDQLVDCVFENCISEFLTLPQSCIGCVEAEVGGDLDVVRKTCESQATSYAYGGAFGTGILSAHPILKTEAFVFDSTTNRRSVLHARIDAGRFDEVDVYCTHLTANLGIIPYVGPADSWTDEQSLQIDDLLAFIDDTSGDRVVLLGDLNNGPTRGLVNGELEPNWLKLSSDFDTPWLDNAEDCTLCGENPLRGVDHDDSAIIDHILSRGMDDASKVTAKRIFDEAITADSCGDTIDARLSDHYGALATFDK